MPDVPFNLSPRLLVVITDRDQTKRLEEILHEKRSILYYMFNAMGTASSEILKAFGLSGTEKTVCLCMAPLIKISSLMTAVVERLEFVNPGHGIAFVIPVSGINAVVSSAFNVELQQYRERLEEYMDKEAEKTVEEARFELIVSVVGKGFSDKVMDAARAAGARGGTIVHARRSGDEESSKFFGISIHEEKEIVAILVHKNQKKGLMQGISSTCGMKTEANGIIFSLPVESCAGISSMEPFQEFES